MEDTLIKRKELIITYKEKVNQMLQNKDITSILPFLQEQMDTVKYDNDLMTIWYLGMIVQKEVAADKKCIFEKENTMEDILARYLQLKFYLRRIEYDVLENANEFISFLSEKNVSEFELLGVTDSVNYDKAKVWKFFQ